MHLMGLWSHRALSAPAWQLQGAMEEPKSGTKCKVV